MIWIAIAAGLLAAGLLTRLGRGRVPGRPETAAGVLHVGGASLLLAMGIVALAQAALLAAAVALAAGLAVLFDLPAASRALASRLPRRQASTVTPFQNAT